MFAYCFFAFGFQLYSQSTVNLPTEVKNRTQEVLKSNAQQSELIPEESTQIINPVLPVSSHNRGLTEEVIGKTIYDLQTNNSIMRRIVNIGDGKISAIWCFGNSSPSFPERGMAYNHRENGSWINNPEYVQNIANIQRVESDRSGFGNLHLLNSGREVIISHQTTVTSLATTINSTVGGQTWNFNVMPSGDLYWPKSGVGGLDGKSIHVIAITEPTAFAGQIYEGMDGALVYNRSLNEGQTWDKIRVLVPGIDSTLYTGFSGDAYNLDVRGNVVAFVIGDLRHNTALFKSTDNGETWSKTIVLPFPFDAYPDTIITDINGDGIADEIPCADGTLSVLIDNNDVCHVWFGNMRMIDNTPGDGAVSYFPGTSGVMYWNENFPEGELPRLIADLVDDDGNGEVTIGLGPAGTPAPYQMGLTSIPSAGIDSQGNIYVSYMAVKDNLNLNGISYRHVYIIKSEDGGNTWSEPLDVTPFDDFTEYSYPSMARSVDDFIHLVYQRDELPGIASAPNAATHDFTENDIVYLAVPKDLDVSIQSIKHEKQNVALFPNPVNDFINIKFNADANQLTQIEIYNLIGQSVKTFSNIALIKGENLLQFNLQDLNQGIYFVNFTSLDGKRFSAKIIKQ